MKINHCRAARAQMLPFLDGELAGELGQQMNDHLSQCARCANYAASLESTSASIERALSGDEAAPPTLDARVMATIRRTPARALSWPRFDPPWARARQFRLALGVASALLIGLFGGHFWWRTPQPAASVALSVALPPHELAASYRMMKNGAMTRGHSEAQVAAQLRALAPRGADARIEVVALHNPDARFVGGCWANIGGRFVPTFCYQWNGKRVSIYQAKCATPQNGMLWVQCAEVSTVSWKHRDKTFVLVAETAPETSLQLARQVNEI